MNVLLNADGTRNRDFRPYISEEETSKSIYLYDPNGPGFHYGLYDTAQPTCGSWLDIYYQYPSKTPASVVSNTGRLHLVRPTWWRHGINRYYDSLMRHSQPS